MNVGDRVRFDDSATSWLIRAEARDGRYHIATCALFGRVYYTILDHHAGVRGPLNIVGQGMGITTLAGPDEGIAETVRLLEEVSELGSYEWEVSHRNYVPLRATVIS